MAAEFGDTTNEPCPHVSWQPRHLSALLPMAADADWLPDNIAAQVPEDPEEAYVWCLEEIALVNRAEADLMRLGDTVPFRWRDAAAGCSCLA